MVISISFGVLKEALADWVVEEEMTSETSGQISHTLMMKSVPIRTARSAKRHTKYYLKGNMHKMEMIEDGQIVIVRPDKKLQWVIDTKTGTYTEIPFDQMEQMQKQMAAVREQMGSERWAALGRIVPTFKNMIEKPEESVFVVRDTGERKKILGYECKHLLILTKGELITMDLWVTEKIPFFGYREWTLSTSGMPSSPSAKYPQIEGFPLESINYAGASGVDILWRKKVTNIEQTSLSMGEFEVPYDFKKIETGMPNLPSLIK